jgi:NAD+ kinase
VRSALIVAHHSRREVAALVDDAVAAFARHGVTAWMTPDDAVAIGRPHLAAERTAATTEAVVSLGGDGTILRAVELVDGLHVPILGINLGQLGYLTEVEPSGLGPAVERLCTGDYRLEPRMLLAVELHRAGTGSPPEPGVPAGRWSALNEAVLEKAEPGHTIRLQVSIDGAPFTSYAADGMIVATPTGSTAYALSVRGPVMSPRLRAVTVVPVAPHMLFDRALVLEPTEVVQLEPVGHRPVALAVDGRRVAGLSEGDSVRCWDAGESALFVRLGPERFHQILKAKFSLADR